MTQKNDAALVADTLSGQREAFTSLVQKHQNYAYGMACGLLSDIELVQDVVQESLLCAYRDLWKLKKPEQFGSWLCGIVKNTAHSAIRKQRGARRLAEELRIEAVDTAPPPDQRILKAEKREQIRSAVKRLDEKHREALSLYYADNMSYREIASRLEVNETTEKGRLQHARNRLRKELKAVGKRFGDVSIMDGAAVEVIEILAAPDAGAAQEDNANAFTAPDAAFIANAFSHALLGDIDTVDDIDYFVNRVFNDIILSNLAKTAERNDVADMGFGRRALRLGRYPCAS